MIALLLGPLGTCPGTSHENIRQPQKDVGKRIQCNTPNSFVKTNPPFKRSDVLAFTQSSPQIYKEYSVAFVSWGGYPQPNARSIAQFCDNIKKAFAVGTRIGAKIGTRTNFSGFIEFAPSEFMESRCIQVDGQPILVPGMETRCYKGYPAYWFCTNSPIVRKYLKANIERAMKCQPFGMMLDDPLGTAAAAIWFGGCYCKYCSESFKKYLKEKYTSYELSKMGVSNIDRFDLKTFHNQFMTMPVAKRPLREDLIDFQLKSAFHLYDDLMSYARKIKGAPIPVSANVNPASKVSGIFLKKINYFSCECPMGAKTGFLDNGMSLFAFKVADALKKPAAIMGTGEDHAFLQEKNLPGMVRCWIAEAYAFGNYFMAPYRLWAYTPEKGSHHYRPRHKSELAPMYQLINRHSYLFDDYEVIARVAFVHSYKSFRTGSNTTESFVKQLASMNVPFELLIAGDDVLKVHLSPEELAKYDIVIIPSDAILANRDSVAMEKYKANGGIVIERIEDLDLSSQIQIISGKKIRATLRSVSGDLKGPIVVHLLNRD